MAEFESGKRALDEIQENKKKITYALFEGIH